MDDFFKRLIMICVGICILVFVTLYILGIGLYVGDSILASGVTAVLGYMYHNDLKLQKLDDGQNAIGNRLTLIENKIFK